MATLSPQVKWAQRKECIILTIDTAPCPKNYNLEVNTNSIIFSAQGSDNGTAYALNLVLYGSICSQYRQSVTDSKLQLSLTRRKAKYWPRLLQAKDKVQFIKTDFERWVDEDSEDEDGDGVSDLCSNWNLMNISGSETVDKPKVSVEPASKELILNIKGTPTLSTSQGKVVATCPMSNSQIRSYFKNKLARNPRNTTISMVVQTWKKVHEAMHTVEGKKFRSQLPIDYLNKCFVIKKQMEWWITNCAVSGAPDDFTTDNKHAVFLVEKECIKERIEEWICTGSFKESVRYPYWEDPQCPIPQYDISKLPKKEFIWMGKPWIPQFEDKSKLNVAYDLDKTTEKLDPFMLNYGDLRVMFD